MSTHNLLDMNSVEKFRNWLADNGKSKNTASTYCLAVKKYLEWMKNETGRYPAKLLGENIKAYKDYLDREGMKATSFNNRIAALKSFNEFLIEKKHQKEMAVTKRDKKKIQQRYASPNKFTEQEVKRFLQTVLEHGNKRDYALVTLLAYTGLRISEALALTFKDVHFESREITIRDSKGGKTRTVLMSDRVARALKVYLKQERDKYRLAEQSEFLFLSNRSRSLTRWAVVKAFKGFSKKADINGVISPHDMRHYFCTVALEHGFDVHEVASMAGHSNIATTLLYTNPSRSKMLDKLNLL